MAERKLRSGESWHVWYGGDHQDGYTLVILRLVEYSSS